jgi:hypothetical protein
MLLVSPTPGSDPNAWGTILNTLHAIVDAHTHKTNSGVKIGATAIQWDADITAAFSGVAYALLGVRAVDFTPEPAADVAALSSALFFNSDDGNNLYVRNSAGVNVRILNGNVLDVASSGGFVGDYISAGAQAGYLDGADTYFFQQQVGAGVNQYARMRSSDIDLFEFKAHPTGGVPAASVRLSSPAALAGSYTITFPGELPAADAVWQISTAGVVTFKTTVATFNIAACAGALPSASAPTYTVDDGTGEAIWTFAAGQRVALPANMLRTGDRITAFGCRANSTPGTGNLDIKLWRKTSTAAPTQIGTTLSHTNTTTDQAQSGLTEVVDAGDEFHLTVRCTAGTPILYSVSVTVDRP